MAATQTIPSPAQQFYDDLVRHGLIVPVGIAGAFGRSAVFEEVLEGVRHMLDREIEEDCAERLLFPPILDRAVLEKSEFLDSFPHLAGSVFSFDGTDVEHNELIARTHSGKPWADLQKMTGVVLNPAACYPVYPTCTGTLPEHGRLIEMENWVFRHEPSAEATRMQAFRVREMVRISAPATVLAWRDAWVERGLDILRGMGLPARAAPASDPFFGRGGRLLAVNQREQKLKIELLVDVLGEGAPTAVASFNYHQDHFGRTFDIHTPNGEIAHSACLGFGLERVVMALFRIHGFDPGRWSVYLRGQLWA